MLPSPPTELIIITMICWQELKIVAPGPIHWPREFSLAKFQEARTDEEKKRKWPWAADGSGDGSGGAFRLRSERGEAPRGR